jgi:hypothetical protein
MFWDNLFAPSSKVKKCKREKTAWLRLNDTIFLWDSIYHIIFERSMTFWKPTLFPFSGKEAPNLMYPLD